MRKIEYVEPEGPFVLLSMGMDGYEEPDLWDLKENEITVFHILARIKHEMDLARQRTGKDYYPFGTAKAFTGTRNKFVEKYGKRDIPILFTLNSKDEKNLNRNGTTRPSIEKLLAPSLGWRKLFDVPSRPRPYRRRTKFETIPDEIHTGGDPTGRQKYYGLRISGLQCFDFRRETEYKASGVMCELMRTGVQFSSSSVRKIVRLFPSPPWLPNTNKA